LKERYSAVPVREPTQGKIIVVTQPKHLTLNRGFRRMGATPSHRLLKSTDGAGREACPSVVIMDGQSAKTTERGGTRGFDGYKRVKDASVTF